jgi:hypothetical protein
LALATVLVAVNIWTGAPLFAVWVGSRIQRSASNGLSMGAVFAVIVLLALLEIVLTLTLTRLGAVYDELTGRPIAARRTSPWLRSMRGEREDIARRRHGISPLERIVVLSVVAAVMAFEAWFFFFAGSSLPNAG